MRYIVRSSYVDVLGYIWMRALCSLRINVSSYDLEHMRDDDGAITRESIEQWLTSHSGDFSEVVDFHASIEDGNESLDFPWSSEENEFAYIDTLGDDE